MVNINWVVLTGDVSTFLLTMSCYCLVVVHILSIIVTFRRVSSEKGVSGVYCAQSVSAEKSFFKLKGEIASISFQWCYLSWNPMKKQLDKLIKIIYPRSLRKSFSTKENKFWYQHRSFNLRQAWKSVCVRKLCIWAYTFMKLRILWIIVIEAFR